MNRPGSVLRALLVIGAVLGWAASAAVAQNQTPTVSPVLPPTDVPFRVSIEQAAFSLPTGLQSYVAATHQGRWLLVSGRTGGLHGFYSTNNNFQPGKQNATVFVVDPSAPSVATRSLADPASGLTPAQVDSLAVVSAQGYQLGRTLYMTGGYGVDTATGQFSTSDARSAIDVPGLMRWVTSPSPGETAAQHIRQIFDPILRVTGGYMTRNRQGMTLLIFGQDFDGFYVPSANGVYTRQVRRFRIVDDGVTLSLAPKGLVGLLSQPLVPDPNYRRRDLNVVPVVTSRFGLEIPGWVALSGVFTPAGGAWTVPVTISQGGMPSMADPSAPATFKQAMNNYAAPTLGLFGNGGNMYTVVLGGISFGFFANGVFKTDAEMPFINQVTAIRIDNRGRFSQHLMEGPVIPSTTVNPGNSLLFGAGAQLIPADGLPAFDNGVLKLDELPAGPIVVGHIVSGIQSTLPNTTKRADSAASPYVFKVTLTRK